MTQLPGDNSVLADADVPRERRRPVKELGARERGFVVGRDPEVAALADFLTAGSSRAAAVVLDGEAGIGKTTLFDAAVAAARAQGFAVFSCRPAEARRHSRSRRSAISCGRRCRRGSSGCRRRSVGRWRRRCCWRRSRGRRRRSGRSRSRLFSAARRARRWPVAGRRRRRAVARCGVCVRARVRAAPAGGGAGRDPGRTAQQRGEAAPLGLDRALPGERLRRVRLGPLSVGATHRLLRRAPRRLVSAAHARRAAPHGRGEPVLRARARTRARAVGWARRRGCAAGRSHARSPGSSRRVSPALSEEVRDVLEPVALLGEPTLAIVAAVDGRPGDGAGTAACGGGCGDRGAGRRARALQPPPAGGAGRGGARP